MNVKLVILGALLLLLVPVALGAQAVNNTILPVPNDTNVTLPPVKYTPDTPFYGLERFIEKVRLWITFNETEKVKLRLHYAEMRLAEARVMAEKNKTQYVAKLLKDYDSELNQTVKQVKFNYEQCLAAQTEKCNKMNLTEKCNALNISQSMCGNLTDTCKMLAEKRCARWANLTEKVSNATMKHIYVLQNVLQKVPEQAKPAIQHAIEVSQVNKNMIKERIAEMRQVREQFKGVVEQMKHWKNQMQNQTMTQNQTMSQNITEGMENMSENGSENGTGAQLPPHEQPRDRIY